MARKISHKKPFRAKAGFHRLDVKTRTMRVLKHQKQQPIGLRVLEIQAQISPDEKKAFYTLLDQMEKNGELWRRKNSVVLAKSAGLVRARPETDQPPVDEELVGAVRTDPEIGFKPDARTDELPAHEKKAVGQVEEGLFPDPFSVDSIRQFHIRHGSTSRIPPAARRRRDLKDSDHTPVSMKPKPGFVNRRSKDFPLFLQRTALLCPFHRLFSKKNAPGTFFVRVGGVY